MFLSCLYDSDSYYQFLKCYVLTKENYISSSHRLSASSELMMNHLPVARFTSRRELICVEIVPWEQFEAPGARFLHCMHISSHKMRCAKRLIGWMGVDALVRSNYSKMLASQRQQKIYGVNARFSL